MPATKAAVEGARNSPSTKAAPANVDRPQAAGQPVVGSTLKVTMGNWTGEPTAYSYSWRIGGTAAQAPDQDTYVVASDALDKTVDCKVTASNADGEASATSNAVGPIKSRPEGSPDGHTIVEEQRARSAAIEQMGVEAYKDSIDDRPPEERTSKQVPGVTPPTKRE
jgi:hypothetical protein